MLTRGMLEPGRPAPYLRYALLGHRFVDGWLLDNGIFAIDRVDAAQRSAGVRGAVAEIGVHHGRLMILLSLLRRLDEAAVAVDLFEDQHLNVDQSGLGDRTAFLRNLRRWDPRAQDVVIATRDSWSLDGAALAELAGGPLRLVSVDGGHTAPLTAHDLRTATDSLGHGGVVVLDDCFNEVFPAVADGAIAFFTEQDTFVPFLAAGNKTFIAAADVADGYREHVERRAESGPWVPQTHAFLGRPLLSLRSFEGRYARAYWRRYARGRLSALRHG